MAAGYSPLRSAALATALAVAVAAAPFPARAESDSLAHQGLIGVGAALCTLVYAPLKVAYAAGGLVVTSLAWLWTWDPAIAGPIIRGSLGGDYVVTPSHLEGRASLRFVGRRR
jgi:hypothetical protein